MSNIKELENEIPDYNEIKERYQQIADEFPELDFRLKVIGIAIETVRSSTDNLESKKAMINFIKDAFDCIIIPLEKFIEDTNISQFTS